MTVHELIEKLQECDMPDAEVIVAMGNGFVNREVTEVAYYQTDGPVFIEGKLQEVK